MKHLLVSNGGWKSGTRSLKGVRANNRGKGMSFWQIRAVAAKAARRRESVR